MVVKVGGYDITIHFVRRSLDRVKSYISISFGITMMPPWMLACRSFHTFKPLASQVRTAIRWFLPLSSMYSERIPAVFSTYLKWSRSGKRSQLQKALPYTLSVGLVIGGKVQVNIRHLVSVKSKESLKGISKPCLFRGVCS